MDILSWMPQLAAVISLGVIAFLALWALIRRYAPVAHGKNLGPHEIIARKADGTCARFKSNLTEVNTHNADNITGIKRILSAAYDLRIKILNNEKKTLKETDPTHVACADKIKNYESQKTSMNNDPDLSRYYRLIVFREGFKKHVFLQHKYVGKSLNEYATPEGNKLTLSFGFQSKGVIMGGMSDEKEELHLPKIGDLNLGRFSLHYFVPDVHLKPLTEVLKEQTELLKRTPSADELVAAYEQSAEPEKSVEPPEYMKQIALFVPASLSLNEQIRSLNDQLRDKDRKLKEMGNDLSAAATERDSLRTMLKAFGFTDKDLNKMVPKKLDIIDMFLFFVPCTIGYFIAQSLNVIPFAGVIVGLLGGGALALSLRR